MDCYSCTKPIKSSNIRMFLDQNKKQQICKKCWEKECEKRFSKTANKTPEEIIKELADKNHRFIKSRDLAEQKEKI
jgi:hypothetical protein